MRDGFHGGKRACTAGVILKCGDDIFGVLPGYFGNVVNLGETGLVARDSVAAYAHGHFGLGSLGVSGDGIVSCLVLCDCCTGRGCGQHCKGAT